MKRAVHAFFKPLKAAAWGLFGLIFTLQNRTPSEAACMHILGPGAVSVGTYLQCLRPPVLSGWLALLPFRLVHSPAQSEQVSRAFAPCCMQGQ